MIRVDTPKIPEGWEPPSMVIEEALFDEVKELTLGLMNLHDDIVNAPVRGRIRRILGIEPERICVTCERKFYGKGDRVECPWCSSLKGKQ